MQMRGLLHFLNKLSGSVALVKIGVILGMTTFCVWVLVSRMSPAASASASLYQLLISAVAGALMVPFFPFLAGLAFGMSCFILWLAHTEKGIHGLAIIMLPVLLVWSLGSASVGFGLGKLVGQGVKGLLGRLAKR